MKTLYLDCGMGAAGDMLAGALLELLPEPEKFVEKLNDLEIPNVQFIIEKTAKCGIQGTRMQVKVNGMEEGTEHHHHNHNEHHHDHDSHHEHSQDHDSHHTHHHTSIHDIEQIVTAIALPEEVQQDILAVYRLIAEAESHAHGVPVTEIHFHEVGTMDAIADITAVCLLIHKLSPENIVVSPVHVGSGQVQCAHGILPVPAPATAHILRGVPIYGGGIKGELCTPTGAALLRHFATSFGDMPVMNTEAIGYGCGKKDFEAANCVRAMLGEAADKADYIYELNCNVDDMTAEAIGFATSRLFAAGALDVFTIPINMKKNRPGTLLCVICEEQDKQKLVSSIFKYTTTLGIRETRNKRYVMHRTVTTLETPYGEVRRKDASGFGVSRSKYEYEDIANIARIKHLSLADAITLIEHG